jgi:heptosyltransferase-2
MDAQTVETHGVLPGKTTSGFAPGVKDPERIVVVQTAFIGDVVLVLSLMQALRDRYPTDFLGLVTTPASAVLAEGHPAVNKVHSFDKRKSRRGIRGLITMVRELRAEKYDVALVPHRSMRSALLCRLSGIPMRVGFDRGLGRHLMSHRVRYTNRHEVVRNATLLVRLGLTLPNPPVPSLHLRPDEVKNASSILDRIEPGGRWVALAPGSIWNTKRWPEESFARLGALLRKSGFSVVLLGSAEDAPLCARVAAAAGDGVANLSGMQGIRGSAALISRCKALVSNDSAPMHLGVAVRTPVVALFGPTSPEFGFAPLGPHDRIVETSGLLCRPCAIHGGKKCPVKTHDCMKKISPERVLNEVLAINRKAG